MKFVMLSARAREGEEVTFKYFLDIKGFIKGFVYRHKLLTIFN